MPARLRPFSVGELLDGAFSLYRRNFISFFAIALVPYVPLVLVWLVLPMFAGADEEALINSTTILSLPYSTLASILIWAALVYGSMRGYEDADVTASEALKVGVRKLLPAAVATIIAVFLIMIGIIFLLIPGLILASMFFGIIPAIVVEDRGPFEAFGRSRKLSKGARLRILGVIVLALLIAALPVMAFSFIAGVAAATRMGSGANATLSLGWQAIVQAGSFVLSALTTPYSVAALTLLYIDRRARTEAPDLEEAAARLSQV
jgi:hypothetical protein